MIWIGLIVVTFCLFVAWAICRAGALADQRIEELSNKDYYTVVKGNG